MNDRQARDFIQQISKSGSVYGLDSIRRLMERLGNVQDQLSIIHAAGTNGKGSVCAMTASILQASGYRTGVYSSPAVFLAEETITVDGEMISPQEFAELATKVQAVCAEMQAEGLAHPTAFEIETAIAFCYFYERNCDFVVLETGLGGELDATNIIRHPLCSVLTSISMDHMALLGDTLAEIAEAKTGIMKPGCPCVSAVQSTKAAELIKNKAGRLGCELYIAEPDLIVDFKYDEQGSCFKLLTKEHKLVDLTAIKERETKRLPASEEKKSGNLSEFEVQKKDFETAPEKQYDNLECISAQGEKYSDASEILYCTLAGEFQRQNLACALTVIKLLQEKGVQIKSKAVSVGLANIHLHGRFECIHKQPDFYIDGAHNEDAVSFLRKTIQNCFTNRSIVYIIGVLADKDYEKALQPILPYAARIYTITPHNERALDGRVLAEWAQLYHPAVSFVPDIAQAAALAIDAAGAGGVVLAFGSFSYLGEIRQAVKKDL